MSEHQPSIFLLVDKALELDVDDQDFVEFRRFYGCFCAILSTLTPKVISRSQRVLDPRFLFRHVGGCCFYPSKKFG